MEARYQLWVLERRGRAFKLERDWTRNYLEDEDRPAELSRLDKLADEHCNTDAESVKRQDQQILDLKDALNVRCVQTWEMLEESKGQGADIDEDKVEEAKKYVELKCPAVGLHDLWIADWIFIRR